MADINFKQNPLPCCCTISYASFSSDEVLFGVDISLKDEQNVSTGVCLEENTAGDDSAGTLTTVTLTTAARTTALASTGSVPTR